LVFAAIPLPSSTPQQSLSLLAQELREFGPNSNDSEAKREAQRNDYPKKVISERNGSKRVGCHRSGRPEHSASSEVQDGKNQQHHRA
jgi:hypothetical protein